MRLSTSLCFACFAALTACAPAGTTSASSAPAPEELYTYDEVIEVRNNASFPVVIKYYRTGSGPHFLSMVGAHRTERLVLPYADVGHIFAETEQGQRLSGGHRPSVVRIDRVSSSDSR